MPSRRIILGFLLVIGCGPDESTGTRGLGEFCVMDSECQSGECWGQCTKECTTNADCGAELLCATRADGTQRCGASCVDWPGFGCRDGSPVACELLDATFCEDCGCADATLRCEPGVGCVPRSDVGGPCRVDSDCTTEHCSDWAQVCRVPVGQPCSAADCDRCMTHESGWSFCSRECRRSSDCNGLPCIGYPADDYYWCRPSCRTLSDPSCPGRCDRADGINYCDCPSCPVVVPQRALLDPCQGDSTCASGECLGATRCGEYVCWTTGYCSMGCLSDSSCGPTGRCVSVPCAPGQTEGCGWKCLPECTEPSSGCETCSDFDGPGGTASVCDPRFGDGSRCSGNASCRSGRCVRNTCTPAGGLTNGGSCSGPEDCASGSCISGVCRGDGLIGDACTMPADCAVGTCCSNECLSSC
jgi:hypothetical protein